MSADYASLGGPVETRDGKLVLAIPLAYGGNDFIECTRGLAAVIDDELIISIPTWLAEKLSIADGSPVIVDNKGGKFNIALDLNPESED